MKPLPAMPPRVRTIIATEASRAGLAPAELLWGGRSRRYCYPRQLAMARVRDLVMADGKPPSYPQIGQWFSSHHATAIHAVRAARLRLEAAA